MTTQQLRNAYLAASFENQTKLTAGQFIQHLAQQRIYISLMTASMLTDDFTILEAQSEVTEKELALAWYTKRQRGDRRPYQPQTKSLKTNV